MPQSHYAPDQAFEEAAAQASGVSGPQPGMAPYPLYGVPPLGQTEAAPVPFYRAPMVVLPVGIAVGFGLGYLVFGKLLPSMKAKMKKNWEEESGK
jgi:hypothetical protein